MLAVARRFLPVWVAFSFLTRLPLGGPMVEPAQLGQVVACFPLVGLAIGALLAGLRLLLTPFSPELVAFGLLVAWVWITGALHLDGLADLFDGIGGGRGDRERTLAIFADSRIGAFGATALILGLLGKWLVVRELVVRGAFIPFVLAPACARWAAVSLMAFLPAARAQGLGHSMTVQTGRTHWALATAALVIALASSGLRLWPAVALVGCVALLLGAWARARLGGITGDVLGALIELAEIAFLFCASALC